MLDAPDRASALLARLEHLPYLTEDLPAIEGTFKQRPEDFEVEELPAYLPSGSGEHLYLWVEKRGLNTQDAITCLARALGTKAADTGCAGLKDRRAVTRQWLSFHHAATPAPETLASEGLRVLAVSRHGNKLRTGHLRGNRFTIRVAGVPEAHDATLEAALTRLRTLGLPNYYGSQRFGHGGKNVRAALAWVAGAERAPGKPFLRKLYVSALQAAIFNVWLGQRLESRAFLSALRGDVLRKEESGGLFTCEDPTLDTARVERWEISPTGPMFGAKMRAAEAESGEREAALLADLGLSASDFARVQKYGEGTRRPARVRLDEVTTRREGDDVVLSFTLPKGSYATVLLAELTKAHGLTLGDDP